MGPPQGANMSGGPVSDFSGVPPMGGAYPSYYQPYPNISPYEYEFNQIANRGGLWESDSQSRIGLPSRWKFRSEYVNMSVERGRDLIGNRNAPLYRDQIRSDLDNAGGGGGGNNLDDYLDALEGVNNGGLGFNLFDPVTAGEIDEPDLNGLRLTLEGENADGSGFELWGMWARDMDTEFDARDDVHPSRGNQPATVAEFIDDPLLFQGGTTLANAPDATEVLQNNLLNLRGIPLDDGTITILADGTTFGGANAVYDLDFQIRTDVEMYGTGLRWKAMPFYNTSVVRIRPNGGFRYTNIQEHFGFFGRDSGILYDTLATGNQPPLRDVKLHSLPNGFDDDGDGIVDNAGLIEDQLGGQGGGGGGGTGTANFTLPIDNVLFPVTSILNNDVESHLAGPELGISYDIGGAKGFRVGGSTNVGLLFNYHRIDMSGDNIFVTTRPSDLIEPTATNANPNTFSSSDSHTSVSPMFEQMVYAEGPLFQYIPLLRRSALLRNANFRAAYTATVIAELTRASDSIIWQGNPSEGIFPEIETSRSTWRTSSWDFGIVWAW